MQACRGHRQRCLPAASAALSALEQRSAARPAQQPAALTCWRAPDPRVACHGQGSALVVVGAELLEVFDEAARVSERDASDGRGRSVLCSCFVYQGEAGGFSDVLGRFRGSSYSCNMTRSHSKSEHRVLGNSSVV